MSENTVNKSLTNYYDVVFGTFSGVLVKEDLMKQIVKENYKHRERIQKLLANNLDDLEVREWTLAYPEGKQTKVDFFDVNTTDEDKLERIKVIENYPEVKYQPDIYEVKGNGDFEKDDAAVIEFYHKEHGTEEKED